MISSYPPAVRRQLLSKLGFGTSPTMLLIYPVIVAMQEISAQFGPMSGHALAGNIGHHSYSESSPIGPEHY